MPNISSWCTFGDTLNGAGPYYWYSIQFSPTAANAHRCSVSSGHTGVVQAALVDGSVRGLSSGISQATWVNALLPADGNVLGPDW